jgi:choice-of-anchor B domain-containing protein
MATTRRLVAGLLLFVVAASTPVVAQWVPVAQKVGFGQAVRADEGTVFVGDPANTYVPGQVFVYTQGEDRAWARRATLTAEKGTINDRFGAALDANDGMLVVGAPSAHSVYVFRQENGVWRQEAQVTTDGISGFGESVEVLGERLFVGATLAGNGASDEEESGEEAVFVYTRDGDGGWTEETVLRGEAVGVAGQFGGTLLATDRGLVVGAPGHQEKGAVVFYRRMETGWTSTQTLAPSSLTEGARFGAALRTAGDRILAGAPRDLDALGSAYVLASDGDTWAVERRLLPFDGRADAAFGAALAYRDSTLWVGAPGTAQETGALYRFRHSGDGWTGGNRISPPKRKPGTQFASTLAITGSTIATGGPGGAYGAGWMALYSTTDDAWTADSPIVAPQSNPYSAMTGEDVSCTDGQVSDFSCRNVDLKAFLPVSDIGGTGGVELNDIWGWTDPKTGTEYALVGRADGTSFVDVSDPNDPVYVGELLKTEGSRVNSWRDIKVYKNHAFIVADNVGDHGMQVFDLTQLREVDPGDMPVTFEMTAHYDRIHSAHNVAINTETGYAYIVGGSAGGESCGGGLHMVNIQDPRNPRFLGCHGGERTSGQGGTGATHDAQCVLYHGPDEAYQEREICIGYNETAIAVVDVTDKDNPETLATATYPNYGYVHQGWFTEDQRYIYSNDEADELQGKVERTRTIVWDMSDLDNPRVANELLLSEPSSDHNLYVKGDRMYQSNYKSGLRILDISSPEQPREIGHFDLFPPSSSPGFEGTWSNYPYFESGIIVTSTYEGGLFVLEPSAPGL